MCHALPPQVVVVKREGRRWVTEHPEFHRFLPLRECSLVMYHIAPGCKVRGRWYLTRAAGRIRGAISSQRRVEHESDSG